MAKDNKALPTVDIKGKPYVLTQHRLLEFHRLYPNGSILTEIVSETEDSVVMITKVMPDAKQQLLLALYTPSAVMCTVCGGTIGMAWTSWFFYKSPSKSPTAHVPRAT